MQIWCRACTKIYNNESYKKSEKRREAISKRNAEELILTKGIVGFYKSQGCLLCNEDCPSCMDFHHIYDNKESNVGELIKYGKKRILSEIRKCVILCANCHRKVHARLLEINIDC